jgi:hypothetical protein
VALENGDIVGLYQPGAIDGIRAGRMGPMGPTTPGLLLGVAIFMAVPALMIFLSLTPPPRVNRGLNMLLGTVYPPWPS